MKTKLSNCGRIVNSGMGGFLNPPTHPEHFKSVQSSYVDTFSMSLSAAADADWLNPATRGRARGILKGWKAPAIESPAVQEWIAQVLGYFAGCYVGQDKAGAPSWNASDLRIDKEADPVANADLHAGVHLIRKYYPAFAPTAEHFAAACWGKKPEAANS